MKKIITIICYLVTLLLVCHFNLQAQVYVDMGASGNGDGTSWANAHQDIAEAVDGAAKGSSLWIAAGKYVLSETLNLVEADLDLYGGSAGTETELVQRVLTNETIISGDTNGDDVVSVISTLGRTVSLTPVN